MTGNSRRPPNGLGRARRFALLILGIALSALWLSSSAVAAPQAQKVNAAADQVLTWTGSDSMTGYASAPTTAVAGPATIVFENSTATGNTTGMTHTLTFDVSGAGYNHDVSVNILASPLDAQGGHHEVQVNLTPGKYHYYCAIPGHQMTGELVVTDGGGSDTTPPQVSASVSGTQDDDGNYVSSATVAVSATDTESGVDKVEYSLDNGAYTTYSGPVTVTGVGSHTVKYRATDKAGNTSPEGSTSFTVVAPQGQDTTPPQVSATVSGTKNPDGSYDGQATVTVTATDTESGVASVEYQLDDTTSFTPYTNPVVVDQPGDHSVQFRATDKAGNTSAAGSVSFTVAAKQQKDTTPPTVSASVSGDKNTDGDYVGSATVTVSATDTESGVDKVEYALDNGSYTTYTTPVSVNDEGSHTVKYRATDKAGNTSPEGSVSFKVVAPSGGDTDPPQVSAQVTGNQDFAWNYVDSAKVAISANDDDSGVDTVEYSLDGQPYTAYTKAFAVNQPGAHKVLIRATDKAGNTSDVSTAHFSVVKS